MRLISSLSLNCQLLLRMLSEHAEVGSWLGCHLKAVKLQLFPLSVLGKSRDLLWGSRVQLLRWRGTGSVLGQNPVWEEEKLFLPDRFMLQLSLQFSHEPFSRAAAVWSCELWLVAGVKVFFLL